MTTQFKISCLNWKEWRDFGDGLYYEYRIAQKGSRRSFPLLFGATSVSDYMEFPVGNPEQNMLNELSVSVVDSLGDKSLFLMDVRVSRALTEGRIYLEGTMYIYAITIQLCI